MAGVLAMPEVRCRTKNSFLHFEVDESPCASKLQRQRSHSDATNLRSCKEDSGYASDSTAATRGTDSEATPDRCGTPDSEAAPDRCGTPDSEVPETRYLLDFGKVEAPVPLRVGTEAAPKKKRRDAPPPLANEITLMVRNIPNKYTPEGLLQTFAAYRPQISFYYLPTDFKNKCNLGYAFVNFCDKEAAQRFAAQLGNAKLPHFEKSEKVLLVQPARVQGLAANVKRFRNSSVMGVLPEECKPMLFENGVQQPFPMPGKKLPPVGPRFRATQ